MSTCLIENYCQILCVISLQHIVDGARADTFIQVIIKAFEVREIFCIQKPYLRSSSTSDRMILAYF